MSMKTSFSLLIALLFSFKNVSANSSELPPEALSFDVNLKLSGFNQEQEEKVYEAIELIKKVIVSQEFRERVLNKEFMGKKASLITAD